MSNFQKVIFTSFGVFLLLILVAIPSSSAKNIILSENAADNIGIGTVSPAQKLDVQGAAQFGTSNINLINSAGRLTGLSSTYLADTNISQLNNNSGYITSSGSVNGYSGTLIREDNRTISPSESTAGRLKFGFTSWANNNTSPYADFLHLRSYSDSSGGLDNLVMFKKNGIGMRVWQQAWGSATAYSSYKDVALEGNDVSFGIVAIATPVSGSQATTKDYVDSAVAGAGGSDIYWTGTSTNLVASTGRTSLGLGSLATQSAVTDAQVPNNITIDHAGTATSLSANGSNCSAGYYPLGVNASGAVESCTLAPAGTGDITAVNSGVGTKGGATSGAATIEFDCSEVDGNQLTCSGEVLQVSEGSGSGLDADLLDGHDTSYFATAGSTLSGSGTTNYIPKWTGTGSQGNSILFDNGVSIGIKDTTPSYTLDINGTGRFTGALIVPTPTLSTHAVTKLYVDNLASSAGSGTTNYVSKWTGTGSQGNSILFDSGVSIGIKDTTPSYTLDINGTGRFTGALIVPTPTSSSHAATKAYVDSVSSGMPLGSNGQTLRHNGTSWIANSSITTDGSSVSVSDTFYAGSSISAQGNIMIQPGSYFTWNHINFPLVGFTDASGMVFRYAGKYYFDDNVGIGSASPGQKLDVVGNVRATGYYSGIYQGITDTIDVRNEDNSGYCTLTIKDGLVTAHNCPDNGGAQEH